MVKSEKLFSFAVVADTHLNQNDFECNSPFEVNKLANARLRYVIDDLNSRDIKYVIHLGDIVHPVPSMGQLYRDSAAVFHEQVSGLKHPLHIIPGNHDVGDKPLKWGPAGTVRQSFLDAWQEHFGEHYFKVESSGIVCLGINAQVLGSGLPLEQEQNHWLIQTLDQHRQNRVFLFSHYPPFLHDANEVEHYDNLGEASRSLILELVEKYQIEGVFAGHVHHFWYHNYQGCHCYLLPSTTFTRQDYSEMFHIGPAPEFGRNDADKLGYLLVHVYHEGHVIEMVRCHGEVKQSKERVIGREVEKPDRLNPVNPATNGIPLMGFDLRHDWCEKIQIPATGGLDEFDRKWVRNDYGLLALMEMGVKRLRIPFADLIDPERRQRLYALAGLGFEFDLYSFGQPSPIAMATLEQHHQLVQSWELAMRPEDMSGLDGQCYKSCQKLGVELLYSPLRQKSEIVSSGQQYYHVINHGFTIRDSDLLHRAKEQGIAEQFDGVIFRCGYQDDLNALLDCCLDLQESANLTTSIHFRLASDDPSQYPEDEQSICHRTAALMCRLWQLSGGQNIRAFCDSLTDNDRGYFPRKGVLDRRFNPGSGYYVVKNLHGLFNLLGEVISSESTKLPDGDQMFKVEAANGKLHMVLSTSYEGFDQSPFGDKSRWLNWQKCAFETTPFFSETDDNQKWPYLCIELNS